MRRFLQSRAVHQILDASITAATSLRSLHSNLHSAQQLSGTFALPRPPFRDKSSPNPLQFSPRQAKLQTRQYESSTSPPRNTSFPEPIRNSHLRPQALNMSDQNHIKGWYPANPKITTLQTMAPQEAAGWSSSSLYAQTPFPSSSPFPFPRQAKAASQGWCTFGPGC